MFENAIINLYIRVVGAAKHHKTLTQASYDLVTPLLLGMKDNNDSLFLSDS